MLTTMHWYLTIRSQGLASNCQTALPYLELRCVGFPSFGIWSASQDAPFVCLEPWMGRCDDYGFTGDLSEKPFINHLKMDEMFETAYTIEVF